MSKEKQEKFLKKLIGMDKVSAERLCTENGYMVRITREGSKYYAITLDMRLTRINLEIDNGIVAMCDIG